MTRLSTLVASAGFGAGLMYFFDPERGKQRRAAFENDCLRLTDLVIDGIDKITNVVDRLTCKTAAATERWSSDAGELSGKNRPPVERPLGRTYAVRHRAERHRKN